MLAGIFKAEIILNVVAAESFILSKINPVVVVITLLVASFATLWKTNEDFRNKVIGIWEQVKGKFQEFSDAITEKINALGFNIDLIAAKNPNLAIAIMSLYEQAKNIHSDDSVQPDEDFQRAIQQLSELFENKLAKERG